MSVPKFVIEIMNTYPALDKDLLINLLVEHECGFEKVRNIFDLMINYGFNREQILQLINLELNLELNLNFYDMYDNIRHIINAYPPYPPNPPDYPDFDIKISNQTLLNLLEHGYSFEEIESLFEYGFIDIDFQWLVSHPQALYADVYHLLGANWSFDEIKNSYDNEPQDNESEDNDVEEGGGKRRCQSRKQCKRSKKQCKKSKKQCKRSKKQCKRSKKQCKTRRRT
jgi:hypothetical protein